MRENSLRCCSLASGSKCIQVFGFISVCQSITPDAATVNDTEYEAEFTEFVFIRGHVRLTIHERSFLLFGFINILLTTSRFVLTNAVDRQVLIHIDQNWLSFHRIKEISTISGVEHTPHTGLFKPNYVNQNKIRSASSVRKDESDSGYVTSMTPVSCGWLPASGDHFVNLQTLIGNR